MSITNESDLRGMQAVSEAVAFTLQRMRAHARPGMSTQELDDYGRQLLQSMGARSAPMLAYDFPGWTCISLNEQVAHGIPSPQAILQEGDLVNIDVSAELNGFWADNGGSFVLGRDLHGHQPLVDASQRVLGRALRAVRGGMRISDLGKLMHQQAKRLGFKVIYNLAGHGVGRSLHEAPREISNYPDPANRQRFRKHSVVAIETFISTRSTLAVTLPDGWTLVGDKGGFVAQHEHTLLITGGKPQVLTAQNGIPF